jgi:hypothetical protein
MFKNILLLPLIAVMLIGGTLSCQSSGGQPAIKPLEQMDDVTYSHWKLYIQLTVKIAAHRLLTERVVTQDQLNLVAGVVDAVTTSPIQAGATSLLGPALAKAGFTSDEVTLAVMIADQELVARGALKNVDPTTGMIQLSARTKEVLGLVSSALRTANITADPNAPAAQ